jgi:hypothetical protein
LIRIGSIAKDIVISASLSDLSLSHNRLKGTIPDQIQKRAWKRLDLGYNKFDGTIANHFIQPANDSHISLQVNRLSGTLPSTLIRAKFIDILNGNLFDCHYNHNDLPHHDPQSSNYDCGSDSVENVGFIWLFILTVVLILAGFGVLIHNGLIARSNHWVQVYLQGEQAYSEWMSVYDADKAPTGEALPNILSMGIALLHVRYGSRNLTLVCSFLLLPLFSILHIYYGSFTHSYIWTASVCFLSGQVPALLLLSLFMVMLCCINYINMRVRSYEQLEQSDVEDQTVGYQFLRRRMSYLLVYIVNLPVVIAANMLYIQMENTYASSVQFISKVAIALFKIGWNDFIVLRILQNAKRFVGLSSKTDRVDLRFEVIVAILNNIIMPCLATAFACSSCFKEAFITTDQVKTTYSYDYCALNTDLGCLPEYFFHVIGKTTYQPPFSYSYQCTSFLIRAYAAVNIYIVVGGTLLVCCVYLPIYHIRALYDVRSPMYATLDQILPPMMRNLPFIIDGDTSVAKPPLMFLKDKFATQVVAKIALLLTFGTVFPPLAPVLCFGIWRDVYLVQLMIGRLICRFRHEGIPWHHALDRECMGVSDILYESIHLLTLIAVFFYGFFIFDIYGDDVGMRRALWAPVVMVIAPLTVMAILLNQEKLKPMVHNVVRKSDHITEDSPIELAQVMRRVDSSNEGKNPLFMS